MCPIYQDTRTQSTIKDIDDYDFEFPCMVQKKKIPVALNEKWKHPGYLLYVTATHEFTDYSETVFSMITTGCFPTSLVIIITQE